ncbi:MAG: LacI family DNA-binding transcriptional regulator [Eubacteriales bacterium]|nr:LacI family DNA-binding transcriptional regulator [Eubacteriales bacterium]
MKSDRVTIIDIAEALGTSSVSVSRALSGQTGVSPDLRDRIIRKASELGYKKLRKPGRPSILVLHKTPYEKEHPNFSSKAQGLEKALQNADMDYSMEFIEKINLDTLSLPFNISKGTAFDGVILIGRFPSAYADFISARIPNVIFYTGYTPAHSYDCVWYNFNRAGYMQCRHLINHGHKDIAFAGDNTSYKNREKLLGITTALEGSGLPLRQEYLIDPAASSAPGDILDSLKRTFRIPTAIICEHDHTAVSLIRLLHDKKLKVPGDISIIGYGNSEISAISIPSLTTVDPDIEYACEAVAALLERKISRPGKPAENIMISGKIIERESVRALCPAIIKSIK